MTPVPLELPLRPAEAAELANLVFDLAEGKPLSEDLRNRLAGRAALLKLHTLTPYPGSLERDPVHRSVYYLAVDGDVPLLLHIAPGNAPTSSIYRKPLLIGRMRRAYGPEMVINAIPFGADDRANVETFAARIQTGFYAQPQGARTSITVEQDFPGAFEVFRGIQKRTGKNFAAVTGNCHAAMWTAIRAGWRTGYSAAADVGPDGDVKGLENASRYAVAIGPGEAGLDEAERVYQQIRNTRAAAKVSRGFDLLLEGTAPMGVEGLREMLEALRTRGRVPQLVCPGIVAEAELDEMAAVAQQYQITLSFRYGGETAEAVRAVGRAMAGRLDYRVGSAADAQFVAENLL